MTIALLATGTELARGDLVNTNSSWLAEQLVALGYEITEHVVVGDDDAHIEAAMRRLAREHQALIVTGGLGPTTDDRTTACVARVLGVPLLRDGRSLDRIEALFSARKLVMQPSNAKQADFPLGATILDNDHGTAPGFFVELGSCRAFFTPGVPAEMRAMFALHIVPALPAPPRPTVLLRLRTFGMPESQVNDSLAGLEAAHQVTLGYRASQSEIEVKILAQQLEGETRGETQERAERARDLAHARLGAVVYAEGQASLPSVVGDLLVARRQHLAVAESCTGGLISSLLTEQSGASGWYLGGVCSYANSAKTALLGVDADLLAEHGAVSAEVAVAMAQGALRAFGSDVALGITGIAGPNGGSAEKPVGLVHWAVVRAGRCASFSRVFSGDRAGIQRRAALNALWSIRAALLEP